MTAQCLENYNIKAESGGSTVYSDDNLDREATEKVLETFNELFEENKFVSESEEETPHYKFRGLNENAVEDYSRPVPNIEKTDFGSGKPLPDLEGLEDTATVYIEENHRD